MTFELIIFKKIGMEWKKFKDNGKKKKKSLSWFSEYLW